MAGARVRNPSSRALAIAADALTPAAPPRIRNRKPAASRPKKTAATKNRKGKSKAADPEEFEEQQDEMEDEEEKEPDLTLCTFSSSGSRRSGQLTTGALFADCICLGFDTGEQPMIQCSSCSNW